MSPLSSWFLLLPLSFLPLWLPQPTKQFPQLPKLSGRPPNSLCAPVGFPVDQSKRLPPISANQSAGGDGTGQSETGMPLTNSNCCYLAQIGLVLAVNGCFHIHTGICLIAAPSRYQPRGGAEAIHGWKQGKLIRWTILNYNWENQEGFKPLQTPWKKLLLKHQKCLAGYLEENPSLLCLTSHMGFKRGWWDCPYWLRLYHVGYKSSWMGLIDKMMWESGVNGGWWVVSDRLSAVMVCFPQSPGTARSLGLDETLRKEKGQTRTDCSPVQMLIFWKFCRGSNCCYKRIGEFIVFSPVLRLNDQIWTPIEMVIIKNSVEAVAVDWLL